MLCGWLADYDDCKPMPVVALMGDAVHPPAAIAVTVSIQAGRALSSPAGQRSVQVAPVC